MSDWKGLACKLKNRRVLVWFNEKENDWYFKFYNLIDREKREIRITKLLLSDEAMDAVIAMHRRHSIERMEKS